jgi:hypothetical protein
MLHIVQPRTYDLVVRYTIRTNPIVHVPYFFIIAICVSELDEKIIEAPMQVGGKPASSWTIFGSMKEP